MQTGVKEAGADRGKWEGKGDPARLEKEEAKEEKAATPEATKQEDSPTSEDEAKRGEEEEQKAADADPQKLAGARLATMATSMTSRWPPMNGMKLSAIPRS